MGTDLGGGTVCEALIKAKSKNEMEDIRLKMWIKDLESQQQNKDKTLFNEIFELKKTAQQMKVGVLKMNMMKTERKRKTKMRSRLPVIKEAVDDDGGNQSLGNRRMSKGVFAPPQEKSFSFFPNKKRTRHRGSSAAFIEEDGENAQTLSGSPTSKFRKLARKTMLANRSISTWNQHRSIPATNQGGWSRIKQLVQGNSDDGLLPVSVRVSRGTALRGVRTDEHEEMWPIKASPLWAPPLWRSQTMPNILSSRLKSKSTHKKSIKAKSSNSPKDVNQGCWAGDPKAIGSVRRPRKNPEDLNSKNQMENEVRKLVRDLPKQCSRNCLHPSLGLAGMGLEDIGASWPTRRRINRSATTLSLPDIAQAAYWTTN